MSTRNIRRALAALSAPSRITYEVAKNWLFLFVTLATICCSSSPCVAADLLFDNGAPFISTGRCDQGPTGCGGTGTWTYYDNFSLAAPSTITEFDYLDVFDQGGPANYSTTNWSLWNGDPFTAGAPVASGSSVATVSPSSGAHLFTVTGLSQSLSAGVYWLGINNTVTNNAITFPFGTPGALFGARHSDGVTQLSAGLPDRVFRIYGTQVPEPGCALVASLATVFALNLRRRAVR
jgi:hypothetical protein